jgi:hypothetical protein
MAYHLSFLFVVPFIRNYPARIHVQLLLRN